MSRQASQLELPGTRHYHHRWQYYIVIVLIITWCVGKVVVEVVAVRGGDNDIERYGMR